MPEPTIVTKQMVEQIFDDTATSYGRVGPSIFSQFGRRLVERMPLVPGMRLLDIATGTAKLHSMLHQDGLHISLPIIYALAQR